MTSNPALPDCDTAADNGVPESLVVEYLSEMDIDACDADTALAVAERCEQIVAFLHGIQVRALARFATLRPGRGRVFDEFTADEVAPALGWTRNGAASRLAHAVDLTRRHPDALTALGRGVLDLYRTRILHEHTVGLDDTQARQVDAIVLGKAAGKNPTAFRRAVRRAVLRIDPHGQDTRHHTARADRRLTLTAQPDGMADLTATLPAEQATALYRRIDRIARGLPADGRSADARRADVFTDLLLTSNPPCGTGVHSDHTGTSSPDPATTTGTRSEHTGTSGGGLRPLVHITVAATTLLGLDQQPAELAGYGPIPAAVARAIAADPTGTWRRILTDPEDGSLLDHGRTTYRPPAALADHVTTRDATCRFPGCHHQARTADLDHTVPYPHGTTSPGNLGALCRHHHRLKHQTQWTVAQDVGRFTWTSPTGRTYSRDPEPLHQPP